MYVYTSEWLNYYLFLALCHDFFRWTLIVGQCRKEMVGWEVVKAEDSAWSRCDVTEQTEMGKSHTTRLRRRDPGHGNNSRFVSTK